MSAIGQPSACAQNIHSSRREKCLKSELFASDRPCPPHLTGAHGLGNGPFNSCSPGIQLPKFGSFLAFARLSKSVVACAHQDGHEALSLLLPYSACAEDKVGRPKQETSHADWAFHVDRGSGANHGSCVQQDRQPAWLANR